jgi:hypothetical protein
MAFMLKIRWDIADGREADFKANQAVLRRRLSGTRRQRVGRDLRQQRVFCGASRKRKRQGAPGRAG